MLKAGRDGGGTPGRRGRGGLTRVRLAADGLEKGGYVDSRSLLFGAVTGSPRMALQSILCAVCLLLPPSWRRRASVASTRQKHEAAGRRPASVERKSPPAGGVANDSADG